MEQNGTPAGEDELILALAAGATVREAAEQAGLGEQAAHRRLADADFRRAVSRARGRMFGSALGRLANLPFSAILSLRLASIGPFTARRALCFLARLVPALQEESAASSSAAESGSSRTAYHWAWN
jgi:hypothetical protein